MSINIWKSVRTMSIPSGLCVVVLLFCRGSRPCARNTKREEHETGETVANQPNTQSYNNKPMKPIQPKYSLDSVGLFEFFCSNPCLEEGVISQLDEENATRSSHPARRRVRAFDAQ